ncbi:MAG: hypothetical protein COU08_00165 [Candidatus Harrisonbacteria bacterium CG10_big_fil_rev_8_21_14_0_10_42_17]|uniref:Solute-binding protein family 5 domain-containing protein n=1 Tax=Candidatus Harrisonbacteria bacterium CG10_big_fil_rev_8_21_14_0_10_42_17 TaxID=1974584 RepID=A0A2M6WJ71_9BACT|nr:MAG: hypothetical protein COU08_00165 [Candidatus Harrisonbacteria bacterium CG10_big_fil_rev_8_21_14_0_10_42_17]
MLYKLHKIYDTLTKKERRIFIGALLLVIATSSLIGVRLFYTKTTVAPIEGGSYTEGVVGQPIYINPLIASGNDVDQDLIEIIFSNVLELAEQIKVSEDQKTWNIVLRREMLWSNGEPITSDDVIFTIETIQDPDTNSPLAASWQGVAVERLSEREIRLTLRSPFAFFESNLKNLKIIPQHIFSAIPNANFRLSDFNLEPVGSGPYVFVKYQKRKDGFITEYNLSVNPNYTGSAPLIQSFKFKFFSNFDEAIEAFNKREIDGLGGLDFVKLQNLKIPREVLEITMPRYYTIFLNSNANPALKRPEVREALSQATDRNGIIELVFENKALPIFGPIPSQTEGYAKDIYENEAFSLETAQKTLEAQGWEKNEETGIYERSIGGEVVKLDFEIIVPDIEFLTNTIEAIRTSWESIGIQITPVILEPAEITRSVLKTRNYQMILFGNILNDSPDVFSFWHSSERFFPGFNLSLYENRTLDTLLESVRGNIASTTRQKALREIQEIILKDRPAIFLYSPNYIYAMPKNLGEFNDTTLTKPSKRFEHVESWYRRTARVFK